jgi:(p)ppGpp synthase/HD superfamily hydrolase
MIDLTPIAFSFAIERHRGQFRKDGKTPYIKHVIDVANFIDNLKLIDTAYTIVAYLHDTLEDTDATYDELKLIFGAHIANYVSLLSYDKTKFQTKKDWLIWLSSIDEDVVLSIKLADRICNSIDFKRSGDVAYAAKYLSQAKPIRNNRILIDNFPTIIGKYDILEKQLAELLPPTF